MKLGLSVFVERTCFSKEVSTMGKRHVTSVITSGLDRRGGKTKGEIALLADGFP